MVVKEEKLQEYIKQIKVPACQLCGNNQWGLSDQIFQLLEFDPNGASIGGSAFPVAAITCKHCGNTLFVNAIVAGLVDKTGESVEG